MQHSSFSSVIINRDFTGCLYLILLPYFMEELFNLLERSGIMPEDLKMELRRIMGVRDFDRWEFWIKPGRVNETLFFLLNGTARCFTIRTSSSNGEQEVNRRFLLKNDFFGSMFKFHHQIEENQFVQALKPCQVLFTPIKDFEATMERYPKFYQVTYHLWCRTDSKEDRISDMLRLPSAAERYGFLLENFIDLARQIPRKYLASFMGLDATTLYKVKGRKLH